MEFCIITPTAGLEKYARLSKHHLVLQHVYDARYKYFYNERRRADDCIILDNGAYEGEELPTVNNYISAIKFYNPQVVVLPDLFLHPWKETWHAAQFYLDKLFHEFPNTEWLYIPQAEAGDINGFLQSYHEAMEDPRITWLGIPRALAYAITDNPLARVEFARMVRKDYPNIKLHAFGMVNGDVHEIPYLAQAGVTSIDSSAPVWRGWNGRRIQDKSWNGLAVDFDAPWSKVNGGTYDGTNIISENLEACGVDASSARR